MAAGVDAFAVFNRQRRIKIALPRLRTFLQRVREDLRLAEAELVICFVTDAEMGRMNAAYRKKSGSTDVLSFPVVSHRRMRSAGLRGGVRRARARTRNGGVKRRADEREYLGDIAISPVIARDNAKKYGRGLDMELRILMLHGVLHLLGYDHETDHGEMNRLEGKLRRRFGLT